jgi:hypothetical protein
VKDSVLLYARSCAVLYDEQHHGKLKLYTLRLLVTLLYEGQCTDCINVILYESVEVRCLIYVYLNI